MFVLGGVREGCRDRSEERGFASMLGAGTAAAAPEATRAVTNWRRSKVIGFPRETQIAVCGFCERLQARDLTVLGIRHFTILFWQ